MCMDSSLCTCPSPAGGGGGSSQAPDRMLSSCHGPAPAPWLHFGPGLLKGRSNSWLLSPAHCKPGAGDRALQPGVIPGWRPQ
ncbi:unnamed protein product, partial [Coccothraustes coccothraustes]